MLKRQFNFHAVGTKDQRSISIVDQEGIVYGTVKLRPWDDLSIDVWDKAERLQSAVLAGYIAGRQQQEPAGFCIEEKKDPEIGSFNIVVGVETGREYGAGLTEKFSLAIEMRRMEKLKSAVEKAYAAGLKDGPL